MRLGTERRIGASECAKLLGLTPKKGNACDVYARIVFGIEQTRTKGMDRGNRVEKPLLRAEYLKTHEATLMLAPREKWVAQHPDYEWATCSPDDIALDAAGEPSVLVEYKSQAWPWALPQWADGAAPKQYVTQVLYSLWVTGLEVGHLWPVFGQDIEEREPLGDGYEVVRSFEMMQAGPLYVFERDAEFEQRFIDVCGEFWWRHVVPRKPPPGEPVNAKRKWRAALKRQSNERKAATNG